MGSLRRPVWKWFSSLIKSVALSVNMNLNKISGTASHCVTANVSVIVWCYNLGHLAFIYKGLSIFVETRLAFFSSCKLLHIAWCWKGIQVFAVVSVKMTAFWNVAPCSLVEIDRRFRGAYCLHHQIALVIEAVSTSETSVNFYVTAGRNIPAYSSPWWWRQQGPLKRW
jgi:hypothetical protein